MKEFLVVGVDISKATLDLCTKPGDHSMQISNNQSGFKSWFLELKKLIGSETRVIVIMEHTGSYSVKFEKFLAGKSINFCKIPALQIKRSLGIIRGKNDKIDAVRIAEYGWLRKEQFKSDEPRDEKLCVLKNLLSLRSKIVRDRSGYTCRLKEIKSTNIIGKSDPMVKIHQRIIKQLSAEIKLLEGQIQDLIEKVAELKQTNSLIRSIKGVGQIVAAYMISCTRNFKAFANARKFNCYAGLAPFKYESGSSIRGRSKVSHLANKEAKSILTLAACCAIKHDNELKKYYQKRVSEGKKKMSCLNIIRAKLVARMFAVAKRQTPFVNLRLAA